MDQDQVAKLALIFVIATAGLTWLLAWEDKPEARPLLLASGVLIVAVTAIILRSRLINAAKIFIARIRESPKQAGLAAQRVLDDDGARSLAGVVAIACVGAGVIGAVESLHSRKVGGVLIWGAVAVVASVGTWYLIAWRRTAEPLARVEALSSAKVVHFTAEDQEDAERFDFSTFRKAELLVKPSEKTNHWRLGIEFSNDRTFSGWRYWFFHPLWHLTKNEGDPRLLVTTYNERAEHKGDQVAIEPYNGERVPVEIEVARETLAVRVAGDPGVSSTFPIQFHRFGRLFAWADDRPYALTVDVRIE